MENAIPRTQLKSLNLKPGGGGGGGGAVALEDIMVDDSGGGGGSSGAAEEETNDIAAKVLIRFNSLIPEKLLIGWAVCT